MNIKTVWSGFRFGTILQVAIGPIGLFIFQTAAKSGITAGLAAALGVTLADITYITAAILGIGALLERSETARCWLKYFGAAVLALFGAATILGVFGINVIPGFSIAEKPGSSFVQALFLTLSSPLTIVFWAGVFASKIAEGAMTSVDIRLFGFGAVLSTMFFMPIIVFAGALTGSFVPQAAIDALNLAVGAMLIFYGARTAFKK